MACSTLGTTLNFSMGMGFTEADLNNITTDYPDDPMRLFRYMAAFIQLRDVLLADNSTMVAAFGRLTTTLVIHGETEAPLAHARLEAGQPEQDDAAMLKELRQLLAKYPDGPNVDDE